MGGRNAGRRAVVDERSWGTVRCGLLVIRSTDARGRANEKRRTTAQVVFEIRVSERAQRCREKEWGIPDGSWNVGSVQREGSERSGSGRGDDNEG